MATKEPSVIAPAKTTEEYMEEIVEYTCPYGADPEHSQPLYVCINGQDILIQRGATVPIPRKYLKVIQHAQEQEQAAYKARMAAQRASQRAMADM